MVYHDIRIQRLHRAMRTILNNFTTLPSPGDDDSGVLGVDFQSITFFIARDGHSICPGCVHDVGINGAPCVYRTMYLADTPPDINTVIRCPHHIEAITTAGCTRDNPNPE